MAEIKNKSIQDFIDGLASKAPTPGGGSAAAVMGAQSAALISMVCNLTIGKPKYAEVEVEMQALLKQSEALRARMIAMIQADIEVFNQLMACYGLPKETESDQTERSLRIQAVLKEATEVPLECARACAEAIKMSRLAAEKGSIGVISDAGVAVMAAFAGLKSAALNVYINTGSLKDKAYAAEKTEELEMMLAGAEDMTNETYLMVKAKL